MQVVYQSRAGCVSVVSQRTVYVQTGVTMSSWSLGILDVGILQNTLALAPKAEELGYARYWVSEHHGEGAIPTPSIAITLVGATTSQIRVGSAGVLLRFYSPLAVAQAFRTFQWLFEGRVDLGVANAGIHDQRLLTALYDGRAGAPTREAFEQRVDTLQALVTDTLAEGHALRGAPIEPPLVPELGPPQFWFLSTSPGSALKAAQMGARYSFHDYLGQNGEQAVKRYLAEFKPSAALSHPDWNVCVDATIADDEEGARTLRSKSRLAELPGARFFVGTSRQFDEFLGQIALEYQTKHIILSTLRGSYDLGAQIRCFELAMESAKRLWAGA